MHIDNKVGRVRFSEGRSELSNGSNKTERPSKASIQRKLNVSIDFLVAE
jgi:hypothetical protein